MNRATVASVTFVDELEQRGLLQQVTDREGLEKLLASQIVPVYAGYDPTSSGLHVGNLVPTIMLKRFQLAGHRPIVLVGGATGMIGDPSGKSDERNLLDEQTLATNVAGIRAELSRLLDFDDPKTGALMTNNYDWTRDVTFLQFLRDVGKHLTVNYMLAKDSVNNRIEAASGISYTEFSYMLLQAFDFVHLAKAHGCRLQVGGSDQYGNITAGCELSHKMRGPQLFGLVAPLLLDSTGQKMGKTASGEKIWLDPGRTTPFAFYQYWLNQPDADAPRLLRLFSLKSLDEIDQIIATHDGDRSKRTVQRELARAMTAWIHGADAIVPIEAASQLMFGDSITGLTESDLRSAAVTIPTVELPRTELETGMTIVELFARSGITPSKGEARRLVEQNGAYLNHVKVTDVARRVTIADLATETMLVLRKGRQTVRLVRLV
ncbi:MAG: tyrosine--tRNA ligase [Deltaproteobacteria bacterium]|nr:tyrosine--tRNA ligase [Deltaproteobacteria bacterium]